MAALEPDLQGEGRGTALVRDTEQICIARRGRLARGVRTSIEVDEPACRPDSVRALTRPDGHPSASTVAGALVRPTRGLGRAALVRPRRSGEPNPLGLAPDGVYPAAPVARSAGGLLHHRFTLTRTLALPGPLAVCLCGTFPRVTPGGCWPPPCSVESGPSSTPRLRSAATVRPARPPQAA